ncbi:MAG: efflux RND transporter periplasmic adaptor subunit [Acidobacteriota bacterium]|nr:efflux RND transporter periplasmic adaptor subunit [Acidobacteriota bacterium]
MNNKLKIFLPLLLLVVGVVATVLIVKARPEVETEAPAPTVPLVRVLEVEPRTLSLDVRSQGTVEPRTETTLFAEVTAKVVDLAPAFAAGGFFERGDALVRLDRRDFELAVTRARSEVARAEVLLAREEAEAELALREWKDLGNSGEAPPLVAREPQVAEARATLAAAQASLEQAELNLQRTVVRAPFAGRVRQKQVGVGQFVSPGQPLGQIYAVDYAEVRLPVPDGQLAFVDLPLVFRGDSKTAAGPEVELTASFGGRRHTWQGRIVRTAGEIDPSSRMLSLVARVDDPYARGDDPERPPLAVGLFVEAVIDGRDQPGVVVLPREALRGGDRVLVLDGKNLRFRPVEVLRRVGDEVYVSEGLRAEEKVCVSPLETAVDGMEVRVAEGGAESDAAGSSAEKPEAGAESPGGR